MAPMGLPRIVKAKYWLASVGSLIVTLTLVTISSCLLRMPWDRVVFFGAVITVMTFSLNGLAAGLGVLYPNFKEANPSKIVSGFGGTFCLVLSFLYILASVLLLGLLVRRWNCGSKTPSPAWAAISAIGFAANLNPDRLAAVWQTFALRHLRNFEF